MMKVSIPANVALAESGDGGVLLARDADCAMTLTRRELALWKLLELGDVGTPDAELAGFIITLAARGLVRVHGVTASIRLLVAYHGPVKGMAIGAVALARQTSGWLEAGWAELFWWFDAAFDRTYGTDTTGRSKAPDLPTSTARHANMYEPTPGHILRVALTAAVPAPETFVFIDVGSGKGRGLLLASHFAFKRVIGIEVSKALHHTALRNLELYRAADRRCFDVTSICIDASELDLPDEDLVLYFRQPFTATVLKPLLAKLSAWSTRGRQLVIIVYAARADFIAAFRALTFVHERGPIHIPRYLQAYSSDRLLVFSNN